jgi:hypothetical protein
MGKLTLSVDGAVVARAKRYASRRGTSLSRLVEQYLELISRTSSGDEESTTPLLRQLRADLQGMSGDISHYRRYLERKYR